MTIVLVSIGWLLAGIVTGAIIEARLQDRTPNPTPDNPSILVELAEARQDADRWHDEYHKADQGFREACRSAMAWKRAAAKWHTRARQHEALLAALGRHVAEGGTLEDEEERRA